MSITSVKSGSGGISLALDNNYMEPIATTVVGVGGSNTIIFNDIPQGYKHLQIRAIANNTSSGTQDAYIRFNSDFSTNYSLHALYGGGATANATNASTYSYMWFGLNGASCGTANSNVFAGTITDILDYANTNKYKTIRSLSGFDTNNATTNINNESISLTSGLWQSAQPIVSIIISPSAGNWAQYSRFSLYGIKG